MDHCNPVFTEVEPKFGINIRDGVVEIKRQVASSEGKKKVVFFWAHWSERCLRMIPVLARVAEELKDSVVFLNVEISAEPNLTTSFSFGVGSVPALLLVKNWDNRRLVPVPSTDKLLGINSFDKIKAFIEDAEKVAAIQL